MAHFIQTMAVIRQLDREIKHAETTDEIDRYLQELDRLYEAIQELADETNYRILLRRITSTKKNAHVVRDTLGNVLEAMNNAVTEEMTDTYWENKQQAESRCMYMVSYIALAYVSIVAIAVSCL